MHFDFDEPVALARLASSTLDVERKTTGLVAAGLGFRQTGKPFPNWTKCAGIGSRVGARCAPNRRLINVDDLVDVVQAVKLHHRPESPPLPLVSLVHLSDNLCKDMGMSYVPGERGQYSDAVLRSLQLSRAGLDQLRERLRRSVAGEIEDLFERCTQA